MITTESVIFGQRYPDWFETRPDGKRAGRPQKISFKSRTAEDEEGLAARIG
jgi:hypothetical protein